MDFSGRVFAGFAQHQPTEQQAEQKQEHAKAAQKNLRHVLLPESINFAIFEIRLMINNFDFLAHHIFEHQMVHLQTAFKPVFFALFCFELDHGHSVHRAILVNFNDLTFDLNTVLLQIIGLEQKAETIICDAYAGQRDDKAYVRGRFESVHGYAYCREPLPSTVFVNTAAVERVRSKMRMVVNYGILFTCMIERGIVSAHDNRIGRFCCHLDF